jgi:hypothetical protein
MDDQPGHGTANRTTTDRQRTGGAGSARDHGRAPEPAAITWTRGRLREQIQQCEAALAPVGWTADRQAHDAERSPLADMEPEP